MVLTGRSHVVAVLRRRLGCWRRSSRRLLLGLGGVWRPWSEFGTVVELWERDREERV
jgi:hypothetical protein